MPLLCISLCALLLLPLTLSCDSRKPDKDIVCGFKQTVQIELDWTKDRIAELLKNSNSTCRTQKRPNCTSNTTDFVTPLFKLACRMTNLSTDTKNLALSVLVSMNCSCDQDGRKRKKRENNRKLCKAMAFLSNMDECYQLLNTKYGHLTDPCKS